jgi:alkyl sulfatase BDS1-like metallo-beta-lactamase superfamily hydrolase
VLTDQKNPTCCGSRTPCCISRKRRRPGKDANATLTLTKPIFIKMMAGTAGPRTLLLSDDLKIDGSKIDLVRFFSLIDKAPGTFRS